jgi:hypothetical protein
MLSHSIVIEHQSAWFTVGMPTYEEKSAAGECMAIIASGKFPGRLSDALSAPDRLSAENCEFSTRIGTRLKENS